MTAIHSNPAPAVRPDPTPPSRRVQTVAGAIFGVLGALALAGGAAVGYASDSRSTDGFLTSDPGRVASERYAVVVPSLDVDGIGSDAAFLRQFVGSIQLTVDGSDQPLFVGVGPSDEVAEYLGAVSYDELVDFQTSPFRTDYEAHNGAAPSGTPTAQNFWVATATSTAPQTLTWDVREGDWSVVLMNVDGSAGVAGSITVGTTLPVLDTIRAVLLWVGGAFLVIGVAMVVGSSVSRSRERHGVDRNPNRI